MLPPPAAAAAALLLLLALSAGANDIASDAAALQAFIAPFGSATVSWNTSQPTCSWTGVVCSGGRVVEVHLPGVGLRGNVPVGALGGLDKLAVLSLRYNALSGPLPSDLAKCAELRVINLQSNHFSGELPPEILALPALTQLNLAENRFSGRIPASIAKNGRLQLLYLDGNLLTGELPNVNMPLLTSFNVSFNNLTGGIPSGLSGMPATSFLGMSLCGKPLAACRTPISIPPSQAPALSPEGAGVDLPRWARSVVREEWTSEVFDTELLRHPGAEDEMVEMLRLAMDCTVTVPDQRPAMPEIVVRIEQLGGAGSARTARSVSMDDADDRPLRPAGSIRES
uniref:Leucine-rich repeat-containing N-terminal plant-type domain-containing protein n=1 Tax=Oryza barthii TaxID=65489 RepID=A0A0D3FWQ6_9ORYZ